MIGIAVIGAGNRAGKYLSCLPDGVVLKYIVEPDALRLEHTARRFGLPEENRFTNAEDFFREVRDIDAVIIAAPDRLHVPIALRAVQKGWHVLLEKPVAQSEEEFTKLLLASAKAGVQVAVCLEMRFHPYFRRIREIVKSGALGRITSVKHIEHIGPDRMAHTFVRGPWSRKEDTGPIFLSKCCHDADFLMWTFGSIRRFDGSDGSLSVFKAANAPEGSTARCLDCPVPDCPYNAVKLYKQRREWTDGFDVPEGSTLDTVIDEELASGRYGRCVYRCDNDVFDTQEVKLVLSGGIKLTLQLEGTSMKEGREMIVRGSNGVLKVKGGVITLPDGTCEDYSDIISQPLHGGSDRLMLEDFFSSIATGRQPLSSLPVTYEGHHLCYLAG